MGEKRPLQSLAMDGMSMVKGLLALVWAIVFLLLGVCLLVGGSWLRAGMAFFLTVYFFAWARHFRAGGYFLFWCHLFWRSLTGRI